MHTAEILSQGDEVVTGQTVDTNAAWLSTQLTGLGYQVVRHTSVGDRLADLVLLFREIGARSQLCVCTGGLGPTDDDLTAQAVAEAFARPLQLDPQALADLVEKYERAGRQMPAVNERQAMLPEGSVRVDNPWGTAPGFAFDGGGCFFVCLPGVPREMKGMFDQLVAPLLAERFAVRPGSLVTLRTIGVGESNLQQLIGPFDEPDVVLSYRTMLSENHLKLRFDPEVGEARITQVVESLASKVGKWVFTIEGLQSVSEALAVFDTSGGSHVEVTARHLADGGHTLATAESCTGGRIAAACTSVPGASAWFLDGRVTYSNAAKVALLGVTSEALDAHGAVSEVVARQMAEGVRTRAGTTFGIGITGIAGPGGGTEAKPVGTVHLALATPERTRHRLLRLPGDRERIQRLAVASALELLRRTLVS